MSLIVSSEKALQPQNRVKHELPNGTVAWQTFFHEKANKDGMGPQSFLVEQSPNSTLEPHYHLENQFQVFVDGNAEVGNHQVSPLMVHYADSYTPYGPIISGEEGIKYFTLRDQLDKSGPHWVPQYRKEIDRTPPRRSFLGKKRVQLMPQKQLSQLKESNMETFIDMRSDGVAAFLLQVAPHQKVMAPDPNSGDGQHWLVVNGNAVSEHSHTLPKWSCIYVNLERKQTEVYAGQKGLEILILQYPKKVKQG